MASAWGQAWGLAWGYSWGSNAQLSGPPGGGGGGVGSRKRRRRGQKPTITETRVETTFPLEDEDLAIVLLMQW